MIDDKYMKEQAKIYDEDFELHTKRTPTFKDRVLKHQVPERFNYFSKFIKQGDKILDIGCYDGYMLYILSKLISNVEYYGIDISEKCVSAAIENTKGLKNIISIKQAYIENIPYNDNSFNIVIISQVIEHLKQPEIALQEALRVVKDGGFLIVSTPIGKNFLDKLHLHFFDYYKIMELFDLLECDYKINYYYKFYKEKNPNIFIVVAVKGKKIEVDDSIE